MCRSARREARHDRGFAGPRRAGKQDRPGRTDLDGVDRVARVQRMGERGGGLRVFQIDGRVHDGFGGAVRHFMPGECAGDTRQPVGMVPAPACALGFAAFGRQCRRVLGRLHRTFLGGGAHADCAVGLFLCGDDDRVRSELPAHLRHGFADRGSGEGAKAHGSTLP